ncbi:hypothetical protein ACX3T3_01825 [Actinotignum schaalii]|uniref:hypothetical protein n=1 Tax=Actinotignum TaxID=1653174 RepID=UPI0004788A4E|nr:hypothetical protein [Actinotignum schaalii]AIE82770.1 hypothetical protein FB03_05300 [Actinotignum schaalii]PLB83653.1 hypothetical protein CYJ16_07925 [Actinotignum timonense]WQN44881.1 hypothetical protein U4A90_07775 [Actinotignum schaalii]
MKRRDLLNELRKVAKAKGEELILTEGGNHTRAQIGDWVEPIPRHREISERLARKILERSKK